jgi:hypothetical protein
LNCDDLHRIFKSSWNKIADENKFQQKVKDGGDKVIYSYKNSNGELVTLNKSTLNQFRDGCVIYVRWEYTYSLCRITPTTPKEGRPVVPDFQFKNNTDCASVYDHIGKEINVPSECLVVKMTSRQHSDTEPEIPQDLDCVVTENLIQVNVGSVNNNHEFGNKRYLWEDLIPGWYMDGDWKKTDTGAIVNFKKLDDSLIKNKKLVQYSQLKRLDLTYTVNIHVRGKIFDLEKVQPVISPKVFEENTTLGTIVKHFLSGKPDKKISWKFNGDSLGDEDV